MAVTKRGDGAFKPEVVNMEDGRARATASTTDPLQLYKMYTTAYSLDTLPEWGSTKLWAMAQAESNRRKAVKALDSDPKLVYGSIERGRAMGEVVSCQQAFLTHEAAVLKALQTKNPQTAKEMRDERALAVLEGGALGNKMRNLHNAGKDNV